MRLDGIYTGPSVNEPDGIRATGTSEEFHKAGNLPVRRMQVFGGLPVAELPADKGVVRDIARKVEIQCSDQRLIDWMQQGD